MSKYLYLSHILSADTPSYGNRDKVDIRPNTEITAGKTANTSVLMLTNNHIGTHIDVPRHFSNIGKRTYDYSIDEYVFHNVACVDIPCQGGELLGVDAFRNLKLSPTTDLLLIRTGFESKRGEDAYWNNNPGLAPELADYFRNTYPHLRCVGFDFISITSWAHHDLGKPAHQNFLTPANGSHEIWIIEDMSLSSVCGTLEEVTVAPLFIEGGNGGAVSVIAKTKQTK